MIKIKKHYIIIFTIIEIIYFVFSILNFVIRGNESISEIIIYFFIANSSFLIVYYGIRFMDYINGSANSRFRYYFMGVGIFAIIFLGMNIFYDLRVLFQLLIPISIVSGCLAGILDIKIKK